MPLGNPLLVKTDTAHCNGRCGGDILLVTDFYRSHGESTGDGRRWSSADIETFAKDSHGDIEAFCASVGPGGEDCGGSIVFTAIQLRSQPWEAAGKRGEWLVNMERV